MKKGTGHRGHGGWHAMGGSSREPLNPSAVHAELSAVYACGLFGLPG